MSMVENMNGIKPITLDSETLQAKKKDMDEIINKTIKTMQTCQSSEGTITVKLKVTIEKRGIANEQAYRTGIIPKFEHDVQSVVQTKDKKSGSMSGEYELVYDAENDRWYMRDIRAQTSMFDADTIVNDVSEVARDENGNQICIGGTMALEAGEDDEINSDEGVNDGDDSSAEYFEDENLDDLDNGADDIEDEDDPE